MFSFLLFISLIAAALYYQYQKPIVVTRRQLKSYILVHSLTVLFFSTSFGLIIYRGLTNPDPPRNGEGMGMTFIVFIPPLIITLATLMITLFLAFFSKAKGYTDHPMGYVARILTIPVGIFGLICFLVSIYGLIVFLVKGR